MNTKLNTTTYLIGIDPGMKNGFAIFDRKEQKLIEVTTLPLFRLFSHIASVSELEPQILIENPFSWIPFKNKNNSTMSVLQGAGAIKQTYRHITEYLDDMKLVYTPTKIQGNYKKLTSKIFQQITGWTERTDEHGRDAAMIVYKR